jgi:tetratricopeptide (TPR) repeat protein
MERAVMEYRRSLDIYPEFTEARINLGEAFNQKGIRSRDEVDFLRGEKEFWGVLRKKPENTLVKLKLGNLYRNMARLLEKPEKFENARRLYNEVLEKDPVNYYANRAMAELLLEEGKKEEGIASLVEMVRRFPSDRVLAYKLVEALVDSGSFPEALTRCKAILARNPFDCRAHSLMAKIFGEEGLDRKTLASYHAHLAKTMK